MEPAWKNKPEPGKEAKRAKAKDAYYAESWIYIPERDIWYSPEEFMKSKESVNMERSRDNSDRFRIRDPKLGILERIERIEKLQQELKDFANRVLAYYDFKRKRK